MLIASNRIFLNPTCQSYIGFPSKLFLSHFWEDRPRLNFFLAQVHGQKYSIFMVKVMEKDIGRSLTFIIDDSIEILNRVKSSTFRYTPRTGIK